MAYIHTMIRVRDLEQSVRFYQHLGLKELRRYENSAGRFTLAFLGDAPGGAEIELTYNWDRDKPYTTGDNFGHLAFLVDDIYATCEQMMTAGVPIVQPPSDGYMAFVKSPDNVPIELIQRGRPLPMKSFWRDMPKLEEW